MKHLLLGRAMSVGLLALLALTRIGWAAELVKTPNDPAAWRLDVQKGAAATMRQDEGALRFDITSRGDQNWHVQVYQLGAQIRDGTTCTLHFMAKASVRRQLVITSQTAASPWRTVMATYPHVELTGEWQSYTVPISFKPMSNEPLRLPIFVLGDATGTVWLKDVSVTDGSPSQPAPSADSSTNLLANPMAVSSWRLDAREAARATLRSEEGMLRIDVASTGRQRSLVQMYQTPAALVAGRGYVLAISLRSTSPRKLTFTALADAADKPLLPTTELSVTPEWKQYKLRFTLKEAAAQTKLPVLQMGDAAGTVFIRSISLVEAGESTASAR